MASAHEARLARDWTIQQIRPVKTRLEKAINDVNVRLAQKNLSALQDLIKTANTRNLQYLTIARKNADDPEELQVMQDLDDSTIDVIEAAELFIEEQAEAKRNEKARRNVEQGYDLYIGILESNVDAMKKRIQDLENTISQDNVIEEDVVASEINAIESRFKEDVDAFLQRVESLASNERTLAAVQRKLQVESDLSATIITLKTNASKKGVKVSPSISRESSPARVSTNQNVKPKLLEFPRFSGDLRTYVVFKKDFKDMVESTGAYSDSQMSHILRSECLQGEPKNMCRNIYSVKDIWARLDDVYHDPQKLVEMITKQISEQKKVNDRDLQGFIKFTDTVERAFLDLSAMGNTQVMDNPMTCRTIEVKLPDWVQLALTAKKSENIDNCDTFGFLLEFLRAKRREARKLATLRDSDNSRHVDKEKKKGQVNAVSSQSGKWVCFVEDCSESVRHFLSTCPEWRKLDQDGKGKVVLKNKLCLLCFSPQHIIANCPKKGKWKKCDIGGCGKWHSRFIQSASVPGLVLAANDENQSTWLMLQNISINKESGVMMWDSGATVSLVTFNFAKKANLRGSCCEFQITGVRDQTSFIKTKLYEIPLQDNEGNQHVIHAYGIDKIIHYDNSQMNTHILSHFAENLSTNDVVTDVGDIDLLVGMTNAQLHPEVHSTYGTTCLYTSKFGSGWIVAGKWNADTKSAGFVGSTGGSVPDFLTAEGLGIQLPRRCKTCLQCKECSFKACHLSWQENIELKAIEDGLSLDMSAGVWVAEYPFKVDPDILVNNRSQAIVMMKNLEKRLVKNKVLDDFNAQFQDTIDRGVFKLLEDDRYEGPINYVSLVDAYKSGDHVTTPIRLCMNSSLKYQGHSLNELLMKGPAALNELFGVLLNFRHYKIGFVKDLQKFYQTVHSCERDQHLRRVVWRFGDVNKEPSTYLTTRVNFGDRPAGTVAQVALRNTVHMYQSIHPIAAKQIVEGSYVDDTLGGAEDRDQASHIAGKMDEIVSHGGFKYKKTVMSGDTLPDNEELKLMVYTKRHFLRRHENQFWHKKERFEK